VREGNFLRIITYAKLRQEEEGVPLVTDVVFLNFAKAEDMRSALGPISSGRGSIKEDVKTNSIIITDTPNAIAKMLSIIKDLDKRTPQVMIEAMMVDVGLTDQDQLGINWSIVDKNVPSRSFTQTLRAGRTEGIIQYGKTLLPMATINALLDFWAQNRKANILANPKVLTLDGLTAKIELVQELPYTQSTVSTDTGSITSSVSFRSAGIKLDVTPHISSGGFISLDIKTEQSFQSGTVSGQPIVDSRKAETNLLAANAETVVIGGLKQRNTTLTIDKLPVLGSLPFIGKAFQKRVYTNTDSELLIFVTPYIYQNGLINEKDRDMYQRGVEIAKTIGEPLGAAYTSPQPPKSEPASEYGERFEKRAVTRQEEPVTMQKKTAVAVVRGPIETKQDKEIPYVKEPQENNEPPLLLNKSPFPLRAP